MNIFLRGQNNTQDFYNSRCNRKFSYYTVIDYLHSLHWLIQSLAHFRTLESVQMLPTHNIYSNGKNFKITSGPKGRLLMIYYAAI